MARFLTAQLSQLTAKLAAFLNDRTILETVNGMNTFVTTGKIFREYVAPEAIATVTKIWMDSTDKKYAVES